MEYTEDFRSLFVLFFTIIGVMASLLWGADAIGDARRREKAEKEKEKDVVYFSLPIDGFPAMCWAWGFQVDKFGYPYNPAHLMFKFNKSILDASPKEVMKVYAVAISERLARMPAGEGRVVIPAQVHGIWATVVGTLTPLHDGIEVIALVDGVLIKVSADERKRLEDLAWNKYLNE